MGDAVYKIVLAGSSAPGSPQIGTPNRCDPPLRSGPHSDGCSIQLSYGGVGDAVYKIVLAGSSAPGSPRRNSLVSSGLLARRENEYRSLKILVIDSNPSAENERLAGKDGMGIGSRYAAVLEKLDPTASISIASPYQNDVAQDDAAEELQRFDGLVFTGSGVSWSVADERANCLARIMAKGFTLGLPVFGSCNGMQLAAVLLGGSVSESPNGREDGVAQGIKLTAAGQIHPMMAGRSSMYAALCVHRDEVIALPARARLLGTNVHSQVQAFSYESDGVDFWGTQYHPEFDPVFLANYLLAKRRLTKEDAEMLMHIDSDEAAAEAFGTTPSAMGFASRTQELGNWLDHIAQRQGKER